MEVNCHACDACNSRMMLIIKQINRCKYKIIENNRERGACYVNINYDGGDGLTFITGTTTSGLKIEVVIPATQEERQIVNT